MTIPEVSFHTIGFERHCVQPQNWLADSPLFFIPTILRNSFNSSNRNVMVFLFILLLLYLELCSKQLRGKQIDTYLSSRRSR